MISYLLRLVCFAIVISLCYFLQELVRLDIVKVDGEGSVRQLLLDVGHGGCVGELVLVPVPHALHDQPACARLALGFTPVDRFETQLKQKRIK